MLHPSPRRPAPTPRPRLQLELLEERVALAADMVLRWNDVLLDAVRADRTAPPLAARNMAIVHAAVYDAVNSVAPTHQPYAILANAPRKASAEAAAAAAAHRALVELFPAQKATFDAALRSALADVPDGPGERQGVALGRRVAREVLALRRDDGAYDTKAYAPGDGPGAWQPTPPAFSQPLLPGWPDVEPFALRSASQFLPPPPPDLASAEYAASFNEVKELGALDSTTRTAEQTEIALFWANGPGTATPPGHWNEVAQTVAEARGTGLAENARLFALLNLALADAGIASWDAKYHYDFWRPVTGIRAADTDGNPDTAADADWAPLLATPPFPAYTSGHSTFSAAAAAVLAGFFGTDDVAFTLRSESPDAKDRAFASFSAAAEESGLSRIYGGIHWSFDNEQGLASGEAIGRFVVGRYLQPLRADGPDCRGEEDRRHPPGRPAERPDARRGWGSQSLVDILFALEALEGSARGRGRR